MIKVKVDDDRSLEYETNSLSRRLINLLLVPSLNSLPTGIRPALKRTHRSADDLIKHATSHKALEILYGHSSAKVKGSMIQELFKRLWLSTSNSKAVRNRLKLVQRELRNKMLSLRAEKKSIKILSIASGSARAIIDSLNHADLKDEKDLSVVFVDKNHEAIAYSKDLAVGHSHQPFFEWVNDTAGQFLDSQRGIRKFNIVEMVGLVDYFDDEKSVQIFSKIYQVLEPDGIFITANIVDNAERPFVTRVVGWKMVYRSAHQLASLLMKAGFTEENLQVFYEPLLIHTIIVARK